MHPSPENHYLAGHATLLLDTYQSLTGRSLIDRTGDPTADAKTLFHAPVFVASHNTLEDPTLTYGNQTALDLFEMPWQTFVGTPSRFTAEPPDRDERARLLAGVTANGFIDNYSGIRISSTGQRFQIHQATVWNLTSPDGTPTGQAATFNTWTALPPAAQRP